MIFYFFVVDVPILYTYVKSRHEYNLRIIRPQHAGHKGFYL